jgi:1,4-dihydroxy-2-naphthoate octaprenyltransferase
MLFIPGWSTLLAGYLITWKSDFFFTPDRFLNLDYSEVFVLLIIFSAAMGASFLLNQLMDIESDLKNQKLFILSEKHITKKSAIIETSILIMISLILSVLDGLWILFSVILFIFLTGYMYNFEPFVLKNRPVGSIIANALMGWLAFAMGWLASNNMSDIHGEEKSNKKTVAVLYGFNIVILFALICYTGSLIAALLLKDNFSMIFIICTLPSFIMVLIKKNVNSTIKTTKYAIFFFAFALWLKIPFYFLILIAIFIFTKWYFLKRFQYDYPNFKGE